MKAHHVRHFAKTAENSNGNGLNNRAAKTMTTEGRKVALAEAIRLNTAAFKMQKVRSNKELEERLAEYADTCEACHAVPTIEGAMLYCGHDHRWSWDIIHGRKKGFDDGDRSTAEILSRFKTLLLSVDSVLASMDLIPASVYVARAGLLEHGHRRKGHDQENADQ